MLFFLDTADVKELREGVAMGLVDGVTTNPSLIAKTGRSFKEVIHEIVDIVDGPISAECVSLNYEEMMAEARPIAKIHKNIVIKLPCTFEGLKATRQLKKEGVPVNMTLCFSPNQALLAAKAGAAYISPFVGRLDDISINGMELIKEIKTIYTQCGFTQTKILVASIRHPLHVKEAGMLGADVSTMPFSILKQLIQHPLTDLGIKRFLEDWAKVPKA